ncbi:hypothetical protein L209DRAFT_757213 [Thermothelomyces heterothallicus CBS 203.75]
MVANEQPDDQEASSRSWVCREAQGVRGAKASISGCPAARPSTSQLQFSPSLDQAVQPLLLLRLNFSAKVLSQSDLSRQQTVATKGN